MKITEIPKLKLQEKPDLRNFHKFRGTLSTSEPVTIYTNINLKKCYGKYDHPLMVVYFTLDRNRVSRLSETFDEDDKERYDRLHAEVVRKRRNKYYRKYNKKFLDRRRAYTYKWLAKNPGYHKKAVSKK